MFEETWVTIATVISVFTFLAFMPRTVANWHKSSKRRKDSLTLSMSCIAPTVVFWGIRIFIPNFYSEHFLIWWLAISGSSLGLYLGSIIKGSL